MFAAVYAAVYGGLCGLAWFFAGVSARRVGLTSDSSHAPQGLNLLFVGSAMSTATLSRCCGKLRVDTRQNSLLKNWVSFLSTTCSLAKTEGCLLDVIQT